MPQVSIIVPVYNVGEELLRACLDSALGQTVTDTEIIVIDDASTDGVSPAVCDEYASRDARVRVIHLTQNGGISNARNTGIEAAVAPYLIFLDADDRIEPDALELLLTTALQTGADIVCADLRRAAVGDKGFRRHNIAALGDRGTPCFEPTEATADALYQRRLNTSPCGKLIRRGICEALPFLPGRYEDLRIVPRWFLAANRIAYLPTPLYIYTDNPASYLHRFNAGRAVVLDVTDELIEYMETNCQELIPAAHDRALSASFNILNLIAANRVSYPDIEARCLATIRRYRRESLFNPRVRLKNKAAITLSYIGGFPAVRLAARLLQKP